MRLLAMLVCLFAGALEAAPAPPSPVALSATGQSGELLLSWAAVTAPAGVTGYQVYRATYPDLSAAVSVGYVTTLNYLSTGLTDGNTYWMAAAGDPSGAQSVALSAVPVAAPVGAPNLTVTAKPFGAGVHVQWGSPVTHGYAVGAYQVEQSLSGVFSVVRTVASTVSQTTLAQTCATAVILRVRALDILGHTGTASITETASFACGPAATAVALSSSALSLAWVGSPGTVNPSALYEVRYATYAGASYAQSTLDVTTSASLTISTQVPLNSSRWYQVFDVDTAGLTSTASNELAVLAPPTGLTATGLQGRVLLDWARPGVSLDQGVTSYLVYYGTFPPQVVPDPGTGSFVHTTVSALADGVPVSFQVAAQGGGGSSHVGDVGLTVSATPYLPAPVIQSLNQTQGGLISLAWTQADVSPNTFAAYRVFSATDSFLTTKSLLATLTVTAATTSVVISPSSGTTDDYWFVQVSDTAGNSSSFTPTTGVLFAPTLLTPVASVSMTSNARVFISWTADVNATEYQIYRATQGVNGPSPVYVSQAAWIVQVNSFIDTKPVNGQLNLYKVLGRRNLSLAQASKRESILPLAVTAMPEVLPGIPGAYKIGTAGFGAYLTATVRSTTGFVDLRWAPSAAGSRLISRYKVYEGRSVNSLAYLTTVYNGLTSYAHASQDPSAEAYGIEAVDLAGAVSLRLTGTPKAFVPWQAPRNPAALVLGASVNLAWSAPLGSGSYPLSGYTVYRLDQANAAMASVTVVTGTSYKDLPPVSAQGSQLSYFISALDDKGISGALTGVAAAFSPAAFTGVTPSAPVSATARTLTGTAVPVLVQWQPNPVAESVTAYEVYQDGFLVLTATSNAIVVTATSVGGSQSYSVRAFNAAGLGTSAAPALPAPLGIRPPAPAFLNVSNVVSSSQTLAYGLQWEDQGVPVGVDSYDVFRNGALLANVGVPTYTDSAIGGFAGTYVTYTVASKVGGFNSITPVALSLSVTAAVAPVGLTATPKNGTVRLDWQPQGQARVYRIYRSTAALGPALGIAPFALTTAPTYTDSVPDDSQIWNYAVGALNELGQSPGSPVSVTPQPGAATALNLSAGFGSSPQVTLTWSSPTGSVSATSYDIWRGSSLDSLAFLTNVSSTGYVDAGLAVNTPFVYQVRSYNLDFSQGPPSKGPIKAFGLPLAPANLSALGGTQRIDLAWDPPSAAQGITGYAMSVDVLDGSNTSFSLSLTAQPCALALTGLASATSYSLSLTARSSSGSSPIASVVAQTNAAGPVAVPISFNAKVGFYKFLEVDLAWASLGSGNKAQIYRSTAPIPLSLAAGGPASAIYLTGMAGSVGQYADLSVTAGQDYYYALTSVGPAGLPGAESLPNQTGPVAPFLYPSAVRLTVTAGLGRVDLQWGPPPPAFRGTAGIGPNPEYRVYRYLASGPTAVFGLQTPDAGFPVRTTGTVYVDTQVVNGSQYQYFVTVVDLAGREQDQGEGRLGIIPRGLPGTPDPPLAVAGDSSVALRWLAQKDDTVLGLKFNVYRREPALGQDYGAPVDSLFQVGPSSVSDFQAVTMVVVTVRDRGDNPGPGTPGNLTNTTQYCYAVSQVNEFGEGGKSLEVCSTPFRPLKPALQGLDIVVVGKKDVRLTWNGQMASGADAGSYPVSPQPFRVYRSVDGGTNYALLTQVTTTAYVDSNTSFGASYVYRVLPVDAMGNEGYSYNLANMVIPSAQNSLLIFRNSFNPATGELAPIQYSLVQPGHAWVRVYTLQGEFVTGLFEEDVSSASTDSPYLSQKKDWDGRNAAGQTVASGVYIVHLEAPGYRANARVAVIK